MAATYYALHLTVYVQTELSPGAEVTLAALLNRSYTLLNSEDVTATQTELEDNGSGDPIWKLTAEVVR
jgi:hypothetical protein